MIFLVKIRELSDSANEDHVLHKKTNDFANEFPCFDNQMPLLIQFRMLIRPHLILLLQFPVLATDELFY